jgi:hypothetical protein
VIEDSPRQTFHLCGGIVKAEGLGDGSMHPQSPSPAALDDAAHLFLFILLRWARGYGA